MTHYIINAPIKYTDDAGNEKTSFRRVGVAFENARRETGETFLSLKLDFPIGVTELVAFQASPEEA